MKHPLGLVAALTLCASLYGCAAGPTLRVDEKHTYSFVDATTNPPLGVKVTDERPVTDRQERTLENGRLHLGDHRFQVSPDRSVAIHLSKLAVDPELPEARRQQLRTSTVRLKSFEVILAPRGVLPVNNGGGMPGVAAIDHVMRSLANVAFSDTWFDLHFVLDIDGQEFTAWRGEKFSGSPSSDETREIFNVAMRHIRRELITRGYEPPQK
jgi:hypothetical protein